MTLDDYPLELTHFRHGSISLEIAAAPDLDALVTEDTDPERIPYWAVLWPSAPVLARWLLDRQAWSGVHVLELGCGAGLVGLSLAAAGARVLQTDLFPEAAALARRNAHLNGIAGAGHAAADWRHWPFRRSWPVIVGSDLLYERYSHASLLRVLDLSLAPGGVVYLADPGRPMSTAFPALAEAAGWTVDVHSIREGIQVLDIKGRRS